MTEIFIRPVGDPDAQWQRIGDSFEEIRFGFQDLEDEIYFAGQSMSKMVTNYSITFDKMSKKDFRAWKKLMQGTRVKHKPLLHNGRKWSNSKGVNKRKGKWQG